MKRSFTVLGLALLLAACARRPGFIPTEAVEAAVAPNCLMECRQLDMTCRAGCLHDWQCVSDVCHGPYSDCLYRCPITNYAAVEPWVKPTPTPARFQPDCEKLWGTPEYRRGIMQKWVDQGAMTQAEFNRCMSLPESMVGLPTPRVTD